MWRKMVRLGSKSNYFLLSLPFKSLVHSCEIRTSTRRNINKECSHTWDNHKLPKNTHAQVGYWRQQSCLCLFHKCSHGRKKQDNDMHKHKKEKCFFFFFLFLFLRLCLFYACSHWDFSGIVHFSFHKWEPDFSPYCCIYILSPLY